MTAGLSRFLTPRAASEPARAREERCELCAEPIGQEHPHLVNLSSRAVLCTCRSCYLLFTPEGAGGGRYRPVPDRYRLLADFHFGPAQWDELQIPVGLAFVFYNSVQERQVAFYPSPAGATESLLPLDAWARVTADNPLVADLTPDVEAALLRRTGDRVDCYLVPIDACYDLVGRVRRYWRGFEGGEEVWRELAAFFDRIAERAVEADGG